MSEPKYIRKWGISPSQFASFEQCAKKFQYVSLDKKGPPWQETHQIKWGNEQHSALEDHVKIGKVLPDNLLHAGKFIQTLRDKGYKLYAEIQVSVNSKWEPCGWWDKDCMVRGKLDLLALHPDTLDAHVFDYKTGKRKNDPSQLQLYALMLFYGLGLKKVQSWYLWLKTKQHDKEVVDHTNANLLRNMFNARIAVMEEAYRTGEFPAKASPLCSWCPLLDTCDEAVLYRKKARFIRGNTG